MNISHRHLRRLIGLIVVLSLAVALVLVLNVRRQYGQLLRSDPDLVPYDSALMTFALDRGAPLFAQHCASCHGKDGKGDRSTGTPDLTDNDWLYGSGQPSEIERIAAYGIRSHNSKAWNLALMPAYARPIPSATQPGIPPLMPGDIADVAEFVLSMGYQGAKAEAGFDRASLARGAAIFAGRGACYDCHAADGQGDSAIGAPNLTDAIWLYGDGTKDAIMRSIAYGLQGVCPARIETLDAGRIRAVSLYVYALSHPATAADAVPRPGE